jgi:ABC transporter substrate binding protein
MGYAEDDAEGQARLNAFRQELAGPGWIEGQTLKTDIRWSAGDVERAAILAGELVGLQPDAILANSTPMTAALHRHTQTIPIVFVPASDPIGSGFVASLSHPGGNITGFIGAAQGDCAWRDARCRDLQSGDGTLCRLLPAFLASCRRGRVTVLMIASFFAARVSSPLQLPRSRVQQPAWRSRSRREQRPSLDALERSESRNTIHLRVAASRSELAQAPSRENIASRQILGAQ